MLVESLEWPGVCGTCRVHAMYLSGRGFELRRVRSFFFSFFLIMFCLLEKRHCYEAIGQCLNVHKCCLANRGSRFRLEPNPATGRRWRSCRTRPAARSKAWRWWPGGWRASRATPSRPRRRFGCWTPSSAARETSWRKESRSKLGPGPAGFFLSIGIRQ